MKVEVVKGRVPFGMKFYQAGAQFNIANEHVAKVFVKTGRVKEVSEQPPKRRRVYRRRDMQAAEKAVMTAEPNE